MADFCKQCSIEVLGKDFGDLAHLLPEGEYTDGMGATALCEGCGCFTTVNYEGECINWHCLKHGEENKVKSQNRV